MPIHQNQWPFPIRAGTTAETGIKVPTCWGFTVINTGTRFYVWSISANDDNGNLKNKNKTTTTFCLVVPCPLQEIQVPLPG